MLSPPVLQSLFTGAAVLLAVLILVTVNALRSTRKLQRQIAELQQNRSDLYDQLAAANQKTAELDHLLREKDVLREQLQQESIQRARADEQATRIPVLESELNELSARLQACQAEITRLKTANAELETLLESERRNAGEKLKLVQSAEAQMVNQFETLAQKILEEKSKNFTEQNKANLDTVLAPLKVQLTEFRQKVDDVYVNDSKDRASLKEAIRILQLENQRMTREAGNLARALKGDKKTQGNWGELVLEKVLEQSGLRKGAEYTTQGGFRDAENRLLKPDVIVHLPENKDVIIDSKVSLAAWETYTNSDNENDQNRILDDHVIAVRNHIAGLSKKDYSSIKGLQSLDFVLMFMPIEAAFLAAFQQDDKLFSDAFENNIIVVTPTTLLATLRTIDNIWRYERQNENAKQISRKGAALYDKFRGLIEDFEKLGVQISTLQGTYDNIANRLYRGKGNLVRQTETFIGLGVKPRKQMPRSVIEQADDEPE